MLTREEILNRIKQHKADLEKKYPIKSIGLFGSFARNEAGKTSDVDLLVDFTAPIGIDFVVLADELEEFLDAKVDLVSRGGVKKQYLDEIEREIIYV